MIYRKKLLSIINDIRLLNKKVSYNDLDLPEKTVINHKRYKIVE
ncbi:TPA: DUF2187 family protein [Staphylococcus aureus]|nr:DUF2187 family protein [Staphylococcus aureus]